MAFKALPVADPVAGAVVDSISLGARLVWSCYQLWHPSRCAPEPDREEEACMSTRSTDGITAGPTTNRGRIRLVVFRVLAAVAGLFFLVAVVLAVPSPWCCSSRRIQRGGEPLVPHGGRQCGCHRGSRVLRARPAEPRALEMLVQLRGNPD
jgi:hypothetical protein